MAVEPTRSQNSTVICRRSPSERQTGYSRASEGRDDAHGFHTRNGLLRTPSRICSGARARTRTRCIAWCRDNILDSAVFEWPTTKRELEKRAARAGPCARSTRRSRGRAGAP